TDTHRSIDIFHSRPSVNGIIRLIEHLNTATRACPLSSARPEPDWFFECRTQPAFKKAAN
ncbi:MAG: hypothetical protein WC202_13230, partial [Desulfobacterales bacterium]